MKLCRIGELGKEKPAIIDKDGSYKDLSSAVSDFNSESLVTVFKGFANLIISQQMQSFFHLTVT